MNFENSPKNRHEKLGEAFQGRDDVVIAKLDATENDTGFCEF